MSALSKFYLTGYSSLVLALIAFAAFATTFLGGLFALRFSDRLHLILGFSAGSVIGVAFFGLLPESIELVGGGFSVATVTSIVALGFVAYLFLDRVITLHAHTDESGHGQKGVLGVGSLSIHSFLDGIAIGLAFQVSSAIGTIVAIAVLAHNFSDGINTVGLTFRNGGTKHTAFRWLAVDATAPVLGMFLSLFFSLPDKTLGILLAVFCGFFFFIGAR